MSRPRALSGTRCNGSCSTRPARPSFPCEAGCRQEARLKHPLLWWPNGEGGQPLYTSRVALLAPDGSKAQVLSQRVGFRRIRSVMGAGAWEREREVPVTQAPSPITFEVNGREIFARGANWVPPSMFPGTVGADTYRPLRDLVAGAHLNFLRLWGGGFANKESFLELCAERGIMLWQEFPLACNDYEGTPAYLALLDRESRSIILRLRRQTALAVWCGGNELFNAWSRMTPQSAPLRLLDRNCFDLDPARPFVPTSPVFNIRHGDYRFRVNGDQDDVFSSSKMPGHRLHGIRRARARPGLRPQGVHSGDRALPSAQGHGMGDPFRILGMGRRQEFLAHAQPDRALLWPERHA